MYEMGGGMELETKLLPLVKKNLLLDHGQDNAFIKRLIAAAVSYAEQYQHRANGYYHKDDALMIPTTEQGIIMLASYWYESRDGSGGLFPDRGTMLAGDASMSAINNLLRMDREVWV